MARDFKKIFLFFLAIISFLYLYFFNHNYLYQTNIKVRLPSVSGYFYPASKKSLEKTIDKLLEKKEPINGLRAVIAPHAGYKYAKKAYGKTYSIIKANKDKFDKVLIIGPSHRVAFNGIALSTADYWQTALGNLKIDKKKSSFLAGLAYVGFLDMAHKQEHAIETQLPFIIKTLGKDIKIIPALVGKANINQVSEFMEYVLADEKALIIISSDFSHYLNNKQAKKLDKKTANAIKNLEYQKLSSKNACGYIPIKAFLKLSQKYKIKATEVYMNNSSDASKNYNRVVGYGSFYFQKTDYSPLDGFEKHTNALIKNHKEKLLFIARKTISANLHNKKFKIKLNDFPSSLTKNAKTFVTLEKDGQLRGCIGSLKSRNPLISDVVKNSYYAAFKDNRFSPVRKSELKDIKVSISIISDAVPIYYENKKDLLNNITKHKDGIILEEGYKSAVYLPKVWDKINNKEMFLKNLKIKAGLKPNYWSNTLRIKKFRAVYAKEE